MNKDKRYESKPAYYPDYYVGGFVILGMIIIMIVFFTFMIVMIGQNDKKMSMTSCEDFSDWVEPPAHCLEYIGDRE